MQLTVSVMRYNWCYRNKLINYPNIVAEAIRAKTNCEIVFNLVPKEHAMSDIYCQLIPND